MDRTESYGAGDYDIWLVKTDSSGNWLWNRTFGGTGTEYGYAVVECSDGNLTIVGSTNSFGAGQYDAWVIYTNSTGHHLWNITLGGAAGDGAYDVIQTSDGNITLVGNTYSYGGSDNDLWLVHLDIDGTHLWNKTVGGDASDSGRCLVETSDGGYAITGETRSYNGGASHYDDVWIVRTNSSGDLIWYTAFPNINHDDAEGIVESSFGGFAVSGTMAVPGFTDRDLWVIRVDDDGNQLWNWTYGDSYDNFGLDIVEMDDSGFAVAGITDTDGWDKDVFLVGVPDTPFWTEIPEDHGLEYDTDFYYDLNATLPHGLSDWWINDTANFAIDQDGKVTNITTLPLGSYGVEVSVNDSLSYILEGEFTLTITDSTDPTWDEPATNRLIEFGNKFSYNLNASDTFGIHHYWINDTSQFTIDGNGVIANISMLPVDEHGILVRAYDPSDNYGTNVFTLTVHDTISPTWVETPQDRIVEFSQGLDYNVNATDLSGISSYWVNATDDFYIGGSGHILGRSTLPVGTHAIELRAYDPYGQYCSCIIIVTVQDTVSPDWAPTPSDSDIEYGLNFSYYIGALDPSGIHHYWINDTVNFAINDDGELTNNTNLMVGDYYLTLRAYDPYGNYCEIEIMITIKDTTAPTVETISTQIVGEYGEDFEYAIVAFDLSGIDSYWISDTTHFTVSDVGSITNITALPVDEYDLDIRVYDIHMNYVEISTQIMIDDTTPPTIIFLDYGEGLSYQLDATDLSGIDYFYCDAFVDFQISDTGLLTNTTFLHEGVYSFEVQVYDIHGNVEYHYITIQVTGPLITTDLGSQMLTIIIALGGIVAVIVVIVSL